MKKLVLRIGIAGVVLVLALFLVLTFFLDGIIRKGVETVAPSLTQTEVQLAKVKLALFSGGGEIEGFRLGNPEGYRTPAAITIGKASLKLSVRSLMSDKIVVHSIRAEAPEITIEGGFKKNNLTQILENINAAAAKVEEETSKEEGEKPEGEKEPGETRIQVDEFLITDARLHLSLSGMAGKSVPLIIPRIELRNLGQGEEGITVAELARQVFSQITSSSVKAAAGGVAELGKDATETLKGAGGTTAEEAQKTIDKIGGLLKKKE